MLKLWCILLSIDISLGGIHNIVVGSDIDETFQEPVSVKDISGVAADGTGVIAPTTTSLLEPVFRGIGRRLKRIAWGWCDKAVTNLSEMIMIKQYSRDKWEKYWKEKLGIKGYFDIQIQSVNLSTRKHF